MNWVVFVQYTGAFCIKVQRIKCMLQFMLLKWVHTNCDTNQQGTMECTKILNIVHFISEFSPFSARIAEWPIFMNRVLKPVLIIITSIILKWPYFHQLYINIWGEPRNPRKTPDSKVIFTFHTKHCKSIHNPIIIITFEDDITVIELISPGSHPRKPKD